jgi:hypothetical protein
MTRGGVQCFRLALSKAPNRVSSSLHLRTEADPVAETLPSSTLIPDDGQSSEPQKFWVSVSHSSSDTSAYNRDALQIWYHSYASVCRDPRHSYEHSTLIGSGLRLRSVGVPFLANVRHAAVSSPILRRQMLSLWRMTSSSQKPLQSTTSHPFPTRSILMLSIHLRLGLPSGLFLSGFPTNNLYTFLFSPSRV